MNKLIFAYIATLALALGGFQNCSQARFATASTDSSSQQAARTPTTNENAVAGSLVVIADPQQVQQGGTTTISATMSDVTNVSYICTSTDGRALATGNLTPAQPSFSLTISQDTNCSFQGTGPNLVAPLLTTLAISVILPTPAPTPAPQPAPVPTPVPTPDPDPVPAPVPAPTPAVCNDIVYVDPQPAAFGYGQNSQVTFNSNFGAALAQLPAGCAFTNISIDFRRFGRWGNSCNYVGSYANLADGRSGTIGFIGGGGSGNKTAVGSAVVSGTAVMLAETTYGWGDADGNSTQACISDVKITIHSQPK